MSKPNYFFRLAAFDHESEPGDTVGYFPGDVLGTALSEAESFMQDCPHYECVVVYRCTFGVYDHSNDMPVELEIHRVRRPEDSGGGADWGDISDAEVAAASDG